MEPLVKILANRFKLKRWLAALLCLLLFMTVISSLGAWLSITLARQVVAFVESAPTHIEDITASLDDINLRIERFAESLPDGWYLPDIQELALSAVTNLFGEGVRDQGMRMFTGVADFFINMILALVSAYFFMADRENIFNTIKNACPMWFKKQMGQTKKGLSRAMGGYFRAQGILMAMVGIISIIGLLILGSPYALFLGLLFAVLDFLPILGPAIVLLPWALISIIAGNMHQAIGLLVIYGIITITRQVMQPKILGDQIGAHPLASLMSIFIGFRIFGLLGFIIGPSLLMIFVAIKESKGDME